MKSPLRILNLEDSPNDAELFQAVLEKDGFAVELVRVETKEEFVAALERGGFDLIVLDFSLPQYNAVAALHVAKEMRTTVPIIVWSGTIGEEYANRCLSEGATDYIAKGREGRIVASVRRVLREFEERRLVQQAFQEAKNALREQADGLQVLERSIIFPPEYKQSGVAILAYFAEVVESKYPEDDVRVTIRQRGPTVTLRIETPDGDIEEIEQTLKQYGLVITGKMSPSDFTNDRELIWKLKTRSEVIALELKLKQEFFLETRKDQEARILSLENQVSSLNAIVAASLSQTNALSEVFKMIAAKNTLSDDIVADLTAINRLTASKYSEENEMALRGAFERIRQKQPSIYERVLAQIGTMPASIMANIATPWVQALFNSLPK